MGNIQPIRLAAALLAPVGLALVAARDRFCRMFEAGGLIRDLEEVYSSIPMKRRVS